MLDARKDKSKHHFSIILNVRDAGVYGHARITWVRHVSDTDWSAVSFGYYADEYSGAFGAFDAPGVVVDEINSGLPDQEARIAMVFWVDEDQFKETLSRVSDWIGNYSYKLLRNDCVTFVSDVLVPLNLNTPSRIFLPKPQQFVVALSELNAVREP